MNMSNVYHCSCANYEYWTSFSNIFLRPTLRKIPAGFMNAWNLNVRSRTPEFAYINAPPAPYKGMQPQGHVHTESTERDSNFFLIFS